MNPETLLTVYLQLTPRQQEVLQLASTDMNNKEIGERLCIAPTSVADNLTIIYETLYQFTNRRPNRLTVVRWYTLFFNQYPHLSNFDDILPLM